MYEEAARTLMAVLREEGIDLERSSLLEIGCGNGYYTRLFHESGVREYSGLDITDVQFGTFRRNWPESLFLRGDITETRPEGAYDLVVMIDVIQHIVTEQKFERAISHVKECLKPGGTLLLSPVAERSGKHLFYVRWWSLQDVRSLFAGYEIAEPFPFRYSHLLAIRKPEVGP